VNLPNSLTIGRIFLVPLLVVVLLTKFNGREVFGVSNDVLGAVIFAVASMTDWLDGYLARRRGQVTGLGQWMDPLADKLLITAALISLVGPAPAWIVAVILGREFSVTVLRSVVHARGQTLPASSLGKVKMVAEVVAILLLILGHDQRQMLLLGQAALWVAMITGVLSGVEYWRQYNAGPSPRAAVPSSSTPRADQSATRNRISA
jgi:CDP-diacylglycerol--glycerol-3-phosphate 3-phosphatidyltransferase